MNQKRKVTATGLTGDFMWAFGAALLMSFATLSAFAAEPPSPPIPIVLADDATPAEVTAANELAAYFGKMTGALFPVMREAEAWMQW